MALTNEQYLTARGGKCPTCQSLRIEAGESIFDGYELTQIVHCQECGARWDDVYETKLVGYDNLEEE